MVGNHRSDPDTRCKLSHKIGGHPVLLAKRDAGNRHDPKASHESSDDDDWFDDDDDEDDDEEDEFGDDDEDEGENGKERADAPSLVALYLRAAVLDKNVEVKDTVAALKNLGELARDYVETTIEAALIRNPAFESSKTCARLQSLLERINIESAQNLSEGSDRRSMGDGVIAITSGKDDDRIG